MRKSAQTIIDDFYNTVPMKEIIKGLLGHNQIEPIEIIQVVLESSDTNVLEEAQDLIFALKKKHANEKKIPLATVRKNINAVAKKIIN